MIKKLIEVFTEVFTDVVVTIMVMTILLGLGILEKLVQTFNKDFYIIVEGLD